ncbi:MAG: DUF6629 family protein [Candidatus Binatia bacterium]
MCISAEASFAVGVGVGLTGVATLQCAGAKSLPWLAAVPALFAVQQCAEGVVWLYLNGEFHRTPVSLTAQYAYLTFALIWWPSYMPLAIALAEPVPWRRRWAFAATLGGVCVSAFDVHYLLTTDLLPTVVGHSIQYGHGALTARMTYGIVSLLPMFVSSLPKLWILGALSFSTFVVADLFFPLTFISVWCLLAAISAIGLWVVVNNYGEQTPSPLT